MTRPRGDNDFDVPAFRQQRRSERVSHPRRGSPAVEKRIGRRLRSLTRAERQEVLAAIVAYGTEGPRLEAALAWALGDADLLPPWDEWHAAYQRAKEASLFLVLADRLEAQGAGPSLDLGRLRRRLARANPKPAGED